MERSRFEKMVGKLRPRLVLQAMKITGDNDAADDIAQETLLRMWTMRDRLDAYNSVEALAMVMNRNIALSMLRSSKPMASLDDPCLAISDSAPPPDAGIIAGETAMTIDKVMSMLAPGQQAVLKMKHVEGMEIPEIARITGSTENNVRVLLCRARARVKELFMKSVNQ